MPVIPNFMERMILLNLNQGPGPLLDGIGALSYQIVNVALKLGVFEALKDGPLTETEVAEQIEASKRGTTLLLEALEAIGYIKKQGDRYTNSPMTNKWMLCDSPNSLAGLFGSYFSGLLERWEYLHESIRRGEPPLLAWEWFDQKPGRWREYQEAQIGMTHMSGDEVVSKVKLRPNARRLLDVGGGHGLNSILFCRKYPALSATVFDWPQALEVTRELITSEGMGGRVTTQEGDFWEDELGQDYDVALLFNIIHMYLPEKNVELFRKVAGALKTGSQIIVMDQLAVKAPGATAKAMARITGLELFNSINGQTYEPNAIAGWLTMAGFNSTQTMLLRKAVGSGLVMGTKV